jgi:hypothetical protein
MGNKKVTGIVLLIVGIVVTAVSLTADKIGIGRVPGFGYWQSLGSVVGAFVAAAGFHMTSGNRKLTGILLLAGGGVLLVASLFADVIGLGAAPGFGYNQIIGSVAGVVAVAVGYFMAFRK